MSDSEYLTDFVTAAEALARDDKRIMQSLWSILNQADAIITHNGEKFDLPKIDYRFLINGLKPRVPARSIDTYKVFKKQFSSSSNSLNWVGQYLTGKNKIKTDYQLWIDCENGNQKAIDKMQVYCKGDVGLLEEVYFYVRPFIKNHPNVGLLIDTDKPVCPNCGSAQFIATGAYYTTQQNAYTTVRCNDCGAVNRTKLSITSSEFKQHMIVPAAH